MKAGFARPSLSYGCPYSSDSFRSDYSNRFLSLPFFSFMVPLR